MEESEEIKISELLEDILDLKSPMSISLLKYQMEWI